MRGNITVWCSLCDTNVFSTTRHVECESCGKRYHTHCIIMYCGFNSTSKNYLCECLNNQITIDMVETNFQTFEKHIHELVYHFVDIYGFIVVNTILAVALSVFLHRIEAISNLALFIHLFDILYLDIEFGRKIKQLYSNFDMSLLASKTVELYDQDGTIITWNGHTRGLTQMIPFMYYIFLIGAVFQGAIYGSTEGEITRLILFYFSVKISLLISGMFEVKGINRNEIQTMGEKINECLLKKHVGIIQNKILFGSTIATY
jgi:hypothetical protein